MGEIRRVGLGSRLDGQRTGVGEPMPTNLDAALLRLSDLVAGQMHLQRSDGFADFRKDPLSVFSSSWVVQDLFSDTELLDSTYQAGKDFRINMQGRLFELLSYAVLSAWQPKDRVVLSPKDTVEFFGKLYPRHRKISTPGGHGTIGGVYVPDGLILKIGQDGTPQVHRVLEYTKNISDKVRDGKHESALVEQTMNNPLFQDAEHVLVFPTQLIQTDILDKLGERVCYQMPFNSSDFGIVADGVISEVLEVTRPATSIDIANRLREQELYVDKGLVEDPMSWSQYVMNNGVTIPLRPEIEEF